MSESRPAPAARKPSATLITEPGIYSMDAEHYHDDPCPTPSLSSGMITDLLVAPAKCRENSKRLNPDWEEPEKQERFSIGSVSHVVFLEPHLFDQKVIVLDHGDYRTKAAREARDHAIECGLTPILAGQMDEVKKARAAFFANEFVRKAFDGGAFEQSLFWRHPEYGFWCRARPDFIRHDRRHICDYKATSNADPTKFGKHAFDMGYHRRAAWYLEGCRVLFDKEPDHYWFINQETKAPYLPSVVELDLLSIEAGQVENDRAAAIFAHCLKTDDWYGYRHHGAPTHDTAFRVGIPTWAHAQIEARN